MTSWAAQTGSCNWQKRQQGIVMKRVLIRLCLSAGHMIQWDQSSVIVEPIQLGVENIALAS